MLILECLVLVISCRTMPGSSLGGGGAFPKLKVLLIACLAVSMLLAIFNRNWRNS